MLYVWFYSSPCYLYMEKIVAFHNFVTAEEIGIHQSVFLCSGPLLYSLWRGWFELLQDRKSWGKTSPFVNESLELLLKSLAALMHALVIHLVCLGPSRPP